MRNFTFIKEDILFKRGGKRRDWYLFLLFVCFWGVSSVSAGTLFSLNFGKYYRITERQDLRIRENGKYRGFLYREYRAFLHADPAVPRQYRGEYYILENMKRNSFLVAKAVDKEYKTVFSIGLQGNMQVKKQFIVPVYRNFPAFAPHAVQKGESWNVSGSALVSDSKGNRVRVPFLCHYIFRGPGTYLKRPVLIIDAQYALRFPSGSSESGQESVMKKISGNRKAVIFLYADSMGGIFIKSDIQQVISYGNGNTEETTGFILTWYSGAAGSVKETADAEIVDTFKALSSPENAPGTQSGANGSSRFKNMSLEQSDRGLVLRIQNIHFMPNTAVILSSEKQRLDTVAALLKKVKNRTFLVTGHTADVGTKESQQRLSVERAKVIVNELVKRGLPPSRFMYQGKGGTEPVASNKTKEGRAANRRVEITILH